MILTNYYQVMHVPPPQGVPLLIGRQTWMNPVVVDEWNPSPFANVHLLFWAYTGIAKERLGLYETS
jgi:hypothetical protein